MTDNAADKIRRLRETRGWSQEELAVAADVSSRTIRRIESQRPMSLETRRAVASALDIDAADLAQAQSPDQETTKDEGPATVSGHIKDGRTLLRALYGHESYHTYLDDTPDETTADLIKTVLSAIGSAKDWDALSHADRYDVQRRLSFAVGDLWIRGWTVWCLDSKEGSLLCCVDEKRRARATLANPQMLATEADLMGVSREALVTFLDGVIDGERITLLAEAARNFGVTPEALSTAMGSTAEFISDRDAWSQSIDRAAASIGISPEQLLMATLEVLRWTRDYTLFKQEHGVLSSEKRDAE